MNQFESVKAAVPLRQAAETYGLTVSRNGMTCCPFHEDRHPSMKAKERYKADHAAELKQFYEARRKLSAEFPDGKFDRQKLDAEYARLEQEHEETYAQFKSIREDSQQLWKIKSCVDSARKNLEQIQKHTSHKQEQEI